MKTKFIVGNSDSAEQQRHILARRTIEPGQLVFVERPLITETSSKETEFAEVDETLENIIESVVLEWRTKRSRPPDFSLPKTCTFVAWGTALGFGARQTSFLLDICTIGSDKAVDYKGNYIGVDRRQVPIARATRGTPKQCRESVQIYHLILQTLRHGASTRVRPRNYEAEIRAQLLYEALPQECLDCVTERKQVFMGLLEAIRNQQHLLRPSWAVPNDGRGDKYALYGIGALLDHSCRANCIVTVDPRTGILSVRTLGRVQAGSKLTINYLDDIQGYPDREFRRRALFLRHGFVCTCKESCMSRADMEVAFLCLLCGNGVHPIEFGRETRNFPCWPSPPILCPRGVIQRPTRRWGCDKCNRVIPSCVFEQAERDVKNLHRRRARVLAPMPLSAVFDTVDFFNVVRPRQPIPVTAELRETLHPSHYLFADALLVRCDNHRELETPFLKHTPAQLDDWEQDVRHAFVRLGHEFDMRSARIVLWISKAHFISGRMVEAAAAGMFAHYHFHHALGPAHDATQVVSGYVDMLNAVTEGGKVRERVMEIMQGRHLETM